MRSLILVAITALALALVASAKREDPEKKKENEISEEDKWTVTKTVFLDFSIDLDEEYKRVTIGLFGEAAPNAVNNFAALAKGNYRGDPRFGYKGTKIHKVIADFLIQGGDITSEDGSGGKSIYGPYFNDEPFTHSHKSKGYVSLANKGVPDTNNSQFFIVLQRARWLDGKHVAFGKVLEGMDVIEKIGNMETDDSGSPKKLVTIEDCGLIRHEPYLLPEASRN